jgi:molybdopterin/thiamine biosynthesis adenylyltransferase
MRFARNRQSIDAAMQLRLLASKVAIIGCGGLGGHVAIELTRIGIGKLILIDPDTFDETNLNRQSFATMDTIGEHKVSVLERELISINPALRISPHIRHLNPKSDFGIISGADVVIDALDDPVIKLSLAQECARRSMPFVHGAIAGMSGQVSVNTTLEHLYHGGSRGAEEKMGNLSFGAAFIASLQAAETIKQILGIGETLNGRVLVTDLLYDEFTQLPA